MNLSNDLGLITTKARNLAGRRRNVKHLARLFLRPEASIRRNKRPINGLSARLSRDQTRLKAVRDPPDVAHKIALKPRRRELLGLAASETGGELLRMRFQPSHRRGQRLGRLLGEENAGARAIG